MAVRGPRPVVLLLRGVNVGGHGRLPMSGLRETLGALGLPDARTHLQSGNAVVSATPAQAGALAARLEGAISERFGVATTVIVRDGAALAEVVAANPFPAEAAADPASVHVAFLAGAPAADDVARLDPERSPGDRFAVHGTEVYLHYPSGSGRSKLTAAYLEQMLGVAATARNWRTVSALLEMAAGG